MRRYIAGVLVFLGSFKRPVLPLPERQAGLLSHLILRGSSSPWSVRFYHPTSTLWSTERKTARTLGYLYCCPLKVMLFPKALLRLEGALASLSQTTAHFKAVCVGVIAT
jgi:hypothetical protein